MNSYGKRGFIKAAMVPVRAVCRNTRGLVRWYWRRLKEAGLSYYTCGILGKNQDARDNLLYAEKYMAELGIIISKLNRQKLSA